MSWWNGTTSIQVIFHFISLWTCVCFFVLFTFTLSHSYILYICIHVFRMLFLFPSCRISFFLNTYFCFAFFIGYWKMNDECMKCKSERGKLEHCTSIEIAMPCRMSFTIHVFNWTIQSEILLRLSSFEAIRPSMLFDSFDGCYCFCYWCCCCRRWCCCCFFYNPFEYLSFL